MLHDKVYLISALATCVHSVKISCSKKHNLNHIHRGRFITVEKLNKQLLIKRKDIKKKLMPKLFIKTIQIRFKCTTKNL